MKTNNTTRAVKVSKQVRRAKWAEEPIRRLTRKANLRIKTGCHNRARISFLQANMLYNMFYPKAVTHAE